MRAVIYARYSSENQHEASIADSWRSAAATSSARARRFAIPSKTQQSAAPAASGQG